MEGFTSKEAFLVCYHALDCPNVRRIEDWKERSVALRTLDDLHDDIELRLDKAKDATVNKKVSLSLRF